MNSSAKMAAMAVRVLPKKFVKHYIMPITVRRTQVPYDSKRFFESWYRSTLNRGFSDGITVSGNYNPLFVQYHYNAVENSILEHFAASSVSDRPHVLDIGSGAGHWIDFYLNVFRAASVTGVEISPPCVDSLRNKYAASDEVRIIKGDVSAPGFSLGQKFDVINAIGVIFHIVDDRSWIRAIGNLASHLKNDGVLVVGGQFGWITRNVQFHETDDFSSWGGYRNTNPDVALVNKRIRSLRYWKTCARQCGLRVVKVRRTKQCRAIATPENNVLFLSPLR